MIVNLGRLQSFDLRDLDHLMSARLTAEDIPPEGDPTRSVYRAKPRRVLDQGAEPQCVAYAGKHWLSAGPVMTDPDRPPSAQELYDRAQARDGFPLPHDGTTVRALLSVLREDGRFSEYVWATSELEMLAWLQRPTPDTSAVVIGIPWFSNMFEPDAEGYIEPKGSPVGGHALLVRGYSASRQAYRLTNSWSVEWGQRGECWLRRDHFAELLADWGEAAGMVEVHTVWHELANAP